MVDAAVAEVPFHDFTREIYYLGYARTSYAPVAVGDVVKKTGRTTNFTTGRVTSVNATVNVNYGAGTSGQVRQPDRHDLDERRRRLRQPGARRRTTTPIGLLFAGSTRSPSSTTSSSSRRCSGCRLAED